MDKNAIKSFAIESRRQMIESVKYQASLIGITAEGISEPISKAEGMETYDYGAGTHSIYDEDIQKRKSLVKEIENKGFDNVVEEVAYTWFNRIIAIRFMEVNDYLPTRTRVLSSEIEGKREPDIITEALELDLDYANEDTELILKLKDENKLDELFRLLFVKQCNKLNDILPGLFEKTDNYMELLLNISFTDENSVIRKLINLISEEDFGNQIEIIGWLYQFYNMELKDETFANLKKRKKITKDRIPAATQLFTPDWIVKYMVENSLGRLWLENHPNDELKNKWKYYIDEVQQDPHVELQLIKIKKQTKIFKPEDIKIIDPCMGSGHILVYIFEILMDIYVSEGYTEKDASELILKNNIYGLDIDKRAYQLAYFAVMMKARSYNRQILTKNILPLIYPIEESNGISQEFINKLLSNYKNYSNELEYIINKFINAKEYGSLVNIKRLNFLDLINNLSNFEFNNGLFGFKYSKEINSLLNIIYQSEVLSQKYDVVITNPPYMGNKGMDNTLKEYLKKYYPNSKLDLFSVFIERCDELCKDYGYLSMITQQSFMFLSTFENLRVNLINNSTIIDMVHLGPHAFDEIGGEVVQATSFVNKKIFIDNYTSSFHRLIDFTSEKEKEKEFFKDNNRFNIIQTDFLKIPGCQYAYWITDNIINTFKTSENMEDYITSFQGIITGNNNKFLKLWYEVPLDKIAFKKPSMDEINLNKTYWIPYNKGGEFRKWYGNLEYVVNWINGPNDKTRGKAQFSEYYLKEFVTWSRISSINLAARYVPPGCLWDVNGSGIFGSEYLYYVQALLSSKLGSIFLRIINPTLAFQVENVLQFPLLIDDSRVDEVNELVKSNINISKKDWDFFETSWDFITHPFLMFEKDLIEDNFNEWVVFQNTNFLKQKSNEIRLNEIFIDIYSLNDEVISSVPDDEITLYIPNKKADVISFISYSIGCMFGRYSLDNKGLQYAGGEFDINRYHKFIPDDDNIIPILDTEYFEDDIVGRFVEFVKVCFGEETLEENLTFIAKVLNKKGKTSREVIRRYLLTDFFKDHIQTYQKCPIYWMFNSGKQNAFNCLIYMHRYDSDIVARVRTDYLHKTQKAIEQNLAHCDTIINNSSSKSEISKATKDKSKYIKQLDEIRNYDEALGHIANQHIEIDLDDGVKVNYAKFQNVEISKEGEKTKKINLLKNI